MTMKNILFSFFICVSTFLFSQDSRDPHIVNDLKISVYDNQNNQLDSLGVFISENNIKGSYRLCVDVIVNARNDGFSGLGISVDESGLDRWYRTLRLAQKEFQKRSNQAVIQNNIKIGGQNPVEIYQWESKDKNGPINRINKKQKYKSYPLSVELISQNNQQELWIYTNGQSSNPKEIAIVFKSFDSFNSFLNSINPGLVRKQFHNHFTLKRKK